MDSTADDNGDERDVPLGQRLVRLGEREEAKGERHLLHKVCVAAYAAREELVAAAARGYLVRAPQADDADGRIWGCGWPRPPRPRASSYTSATLSKSL